MRPTGAYRVFWRVEGFSGGAGLSEERGALLLYCATVPELQGPPDW